jgi:hypothetical protein
MVTIEIDERKIGQGEKTYFITETVLKKIENYRWNNF